MRNAASGFKEDAGVGSCGARRQCPLIPAGTGHPEEHQTDLQQHIDPSSHLMTDESPIYYMRKPDYAKHSTISHKAHEYSRREADFTVTTNTVESFFSLTEAGELRHLPPHEPQLSGPVLRRARFHPQRAQADLRTAYGKGAQGDVRQAANAQRAHRALNKPAKMRKYFLGHVLTLLSRASNLRLDG